MISLKEALVRKNRDIDTDSIIKEEILSFLSSTYSASKDNQYSIYKDKDKWIVDADHSLIVSDFNIQHLTNGLFEFGVVKGYFDCNDCPNLKSLEGAPKEVGGSFSCRNCPNLKSLEGAPEKIDGSFSCRWCKNLSSLKGAPKEISGNFLCCGCEKLKSLEGAPEEIDGTFDCSNCPNLKSLEGAPKVIKGEFIHDKI